MVVDICFDDQTIAMINYDKSIDHLEIEILLQEDASSNLVFPLKDFLDVLERAKKLAIQCAEEDRLREQK